MEKKRWGTRRCETYLNQRGCGNNCGKTWWNQRTNTRKHKVLEYTFEANSDFKHTKNRVEETRKNLDLKHNPQSTHFITNKKEKKFDKKPMEKKRDEEQEKTGIALSFDKILDLKHNPQLTHFITNKRDTKFNKNQWKKKDPHKKTWIDDKERNIHKPKRVDAWRLWNSPE